MMSSTWAAALAEALEASVQAYCLDRPVIALAGFNPLSGASAEAHRLACQQVGLPLGEGGV